MTEPAILTTPPVSTTTETPTSESTAAPSTLAVADDEPVLNKREFVELRKEVRALRKLFEGRTAETTVAAPTTPSLDAAKLQAELSFRDALDGAGLHDANQRAILRRLWAAEKPQDISGWLNETAPTVLGVRRPTPAPVARTDTGAPATDRKTVIPDSISALTPAMVASMSPADIVNHYETKVRPRSNSHNPLAAALQKRRTTTPDLSPVIDQLSKIQRGGR